MERRGLTAPGTLWYVAAMRYPISLLAFALVTLAACGGGGVLIVVDGGGGAGGSPQGPAHPCGFAGSDEANKCASLTPGSVAYCADDDSGAAPFSDCELVQGTDPRLWCCPFSGGAS